MGLAASYQLQGQRVPKSKNLEISTGSFGDEEGITNWLSASTWVKGTEVREAEEGTLKEPAKGAQCLR